MLPEIFLLRIYFILRAIRISRWYFCGPAEIKSTGPLKQPLYWICYWHLNGDSCPEGRVPKVAPSSVI